jgi:hypothetical protein
MEQTNMGTTNPLEILFNETEAQRTGDSLKPGSTATPFSTFFWAALSYTHKQVEADRLTAEASLADDIEWDLMNDGQIRKGKKEVTSFL